MASYSEATSSAKSSLASAQSDVTAYVQVLSDARDKLAAYKASTGNGNGDHTYKLLHTFLECLPTEGARIIARDIVECTTSGGVETLRDFAQHLLTAILKPMKAHVMTPLATPSPAWVPTQTSDSSPQRWRAWLKAACLRRDGNKCVLIGAYDLAQSVKLPEGTLDETVITEATEAAHIIPFAMGNFISSEMHQSAIIWDALYRCFPSIRARMDFSTAKINEPYNAVTLCSRLHTLFGRFALTLEPTSIESVYRVKRYRGFPSLWNTFIPQDAVITLTTSDPGVALPSRYLLELHSSVAKILHLSGMGEYIERIMREQEELRCLSGDGSTKIQRLLMAL
ncbi:hypothetical protein BDZ91DRAFT_651460 [Kalaharituber pfeilii]|nr:hypothetical protein BDZ91DRAFT_651460 [Kalaharituber pfeilii]